LLASTTVLLAACGSTGPASPTVGPTSSAPPTSTASPTSTGSPAAVSPDAPSPTAGASTSDPAGSGPTQAPSDAVVLPDPALIAALPPVVAGLAAQPDPARDAELVGAAELAKVASGLATALYIDPTLGDFAYATVVRLRDGGLDEATFADWRASFDEGACSQAGGVDGHAEAVIGGRRTFIGTCAGGVRTYHTLVEGGLLVSVSSLGDAMLGEQVIAGLRPLT
jgi:hypothetical protein